LVGCSAVRSRPGGRRLTDYHINVFYSDEDGGYIADIPDRDACSAFGASAAEALAEVEKARDAWLAAAREAGKPVPGASLPAGDLRAIVRPRRRPAEEVYLQLHYETDLIVLSFPPYRTGPFSLVRTACMPYASDYQEVTMRTKVGLTLLAFSLAGAVTAAPASAEERACRGTIGAGTVDNLRVPQGATCTLNGTRVKGTVKVERGATLKARGIRVVGNVQAEGAARVNVTSSRVGGSVQIVQGKSSTVSGNTVNGDVQYFENSGSLSITRNRIDGNLQCKENSRRPAGGGNSCRATRRISAPASSGPTPRVGQTQRAAEGRPSRIGGRSHGRADLRSR